MTSYHMCVDVRGMLKWSRAHTKKMLTSITKTDGTRYATVDEFRDELFDTLAKGHEVLPMGDCDNFDFKTGCKGHDK